MKNNIFSAYSANRYKCLPFKTDDISNRGNVAATPIAYIVFVL
jgi:hypothetical protein